MTFKEKYLKYKLKYLNLKKKLHGGMTQMELMELIELMGKEEAVWQLKQRKKRMIQEGNDYQAQILENQIAQIEAEEINEAKQKAENQIAQIEAKEINQTKQKADKEAIYEVVSEFNPEEEEWMSPEIAHRAMMNEEEDEEEIEFRKAKEEAAEKAKREAEAAAEVEAEAEAAAAAEAEAAAETPAEIEAKAVKEKKRMKCIREYMKEEKRKKEEQASQIGETEKVNEQARKELLELDEEVERVLAKVEYEKTEAENQLNLLYELDDSVADALIGKNAGDIEVKKTNLRNKRVRYLDGEKLMEEADKVKELYNEAIEADTLEKAKESLEKAKKYRYKIKNMIYNLQNIDYYKSLEDHTDLSNTKLYSAEEAADNVAAAKQKLEEAEKKVENADKEVMEKENIYKEAIEYELDTTEEENIFTTEEKENRFATEEEYRFAKLAIAEAANKAAIEALAKAEEAADKAAEEEALTKKANAEKEVAAAKQRIKALQEKQDTKVAAEKQKLEAAEKKLVKALDNKETKRRELQRAMISLEEAKIREETPEGFAAKKKAEEEAEEDERTRKMNYQKKVEKEYNEMAEQISITMMISGTQKAADELILLNNKGMNIVKLLEAMEAPDRKKVWEKLPESYQKDTFNKMSEDKKEEINKILQEEREAKDRDYEADRVVSDVNMVTRIKNAARKVVGI